MDGRDPAAGPSGVRPIPRLRPPRRRIDVETPFGVVTSVITTRSLKQLEITVGAEVLALVKATEVAIARL